MCFMVEETRRQGDEHLQIVEHSIMSRESAKGSDRLCCCWLLAVGTLGLGWLNRHPTQARTDGRTEERNGRLVVLGGLLDRMRLRLRLR